MIKHFTQPTPDEAKHWPVALRYAKTKCHGDEQAKAYAWSVMQMEFSRLVDFSGFETLDTKGDK